MDFQRIKLKIINKHIPCVKKMRDKIEHVTWRHEKYETQIENIEIKSHNFRDETYIRLKTDHRLQKISLVN